MTEGMVVDFPDVVVTVTRHHRGYFQAAVVTKDGKPTTFDCGHCHHTHETANACVRRVVTAWHTWSAEPIRMVRIQGGCVVFECSHGQSTRRFRVDVTCAELEVV